MEGIFGFFGGIFVSMMTVIVAERMTRNRERDAKKEERRFAIYMKMMDLHSQYFWISSAEVRGEAAPQEMMTKCWHSAWQIADMLRAADDVEFLEDILDVILGPGFKSAAERHDAMGALIDDLGVFVNPRYAARIKDISRENLALLAAGKASNAPGAMR